MMASVARVLIDSPLPQLDKLFDYSIPEALRSEISVGQRVEVTLGRTKGKVFGFVIELLENSEFSGKLSSVVGIASPVVYLTPEIYTLAAKVSERQATHVSEILKVAIPSFMPTIEKNYSAPNIVSEEIPNAPVWSKQLCAAETATVIGRGNRSTLIVEPRQVSALTDGKDFSTASWIALFIDAAFGSLNRNQSTILVVPDFRDVGRLIDAFSRVGLGDYVVDYSSTGTKSKKYTAFLRCLENYPVVVIGTKSALFAPVENLGGILLWDESDSALVDQSAPYLLYKDVALIRQQLTDCFLVLASHSRSSDVQRLIELDFLKDITLNFPVPKVAVSDPGMRIDSLAFNTVREGLKLGPVLVQVSSKGDTQSLYCNACDLIARCDSCQGPLWLSDSDTLKCRWCNRFALDYKCSCGSVSLSRGRPGSSRTAFELGKSFAGAKVIEATGEKIIRSVSSKNTLVICTPGAEPIAKNGYSAVVILDANVELSRPTLRSTETAVRHWANAIALLEQTGRAVVAGLSGELGKHFSLWSHELVAKRELANRRELSFPPVVRLGSVTAEQSMVEQIAVGLKKVEQVRIIGSAPVMGDSAANQWRLIFKYPHSAGIEVAQLLKVESLKIGSGKTLANKSGRNTRPIRIKMDDTEVI